MLEMIVQPNPFGEPSDVEWLNQFEQSTDFWNRSPQLQKVAHIAAVKEISPWGLLLAVQLHRLSHIPPNVVLVDRDGTPDTIGGLFGGTSLNMFAGLVGETGDGKSSVFKKASGLLPPSHTPISDGTGQGLVKSIAETEKVTTEDGQKLSEPYYITRFNRHSLVVHAPEIGTLSSEFAREGSKTASMMRSLWSGETVGMTTGDRDRRVTLPSNMYRIVGMWGVQPEKAAAIIEDVDGGDPQRFAWAPVWEYREKSDLLAVRHDPGQVTFPLPVFGQVGSNPFGVSGGEMPTEYRDGDPLPAPIWVQWSHDMCTDVTAFNNEFKKSKRAFGGPYNDRDPAQAEEYRALKVKSHFVLTRIKLAAIMGFLHGRPDPTNLDWELAGYQMEVSTRELAGIWKRTNQAVLDAIVRDGHQAGLRMHAAQQSRNDLGDREYGNLMNQIYLFLAQNGPASNTVIRKFVGGGDSKRKAVAGILHELEFERGLVRRDIHRNYWAFYEGQPCAGDSGERFVQYVPKSEKADG